MDYVRITWGDKIGLYPLTSSYTDEPYMRVSGSYLPLTTNTSNMIGETQPKIIMNGWTYRPLRLVSSSSSTTFLTTSSTTDHMQEITALTETQTTNTIYHTCSSTSSTEYLTSESTYGTKSKTLTTGARLSVVETVAKYRSMGSQSRSTSYTTATFVYSQTSIETDKTLCFKIGAGVSNPSKYTSSYTDHTTASLGGLTTGPILFWVTNTNAVSTTIINDVLCTQSKKTYYSYSKSGEKITTTSETSKTSPYGYFGTMSLMDVYASGWQVSKYVTATQQMTAITYTRNRTTAYTFSLTGRASTSSFENTMIVKVSGSNSKTEPDGYLTTEVTYSTIYHTRSSTSLIEYETGSVTTAYSGIYYTSVSANDGWI